MDETQTTQELDFSDFYEADGAGDDGNQTEDTEVDTEETETEHNDQAEDPVEDEGGSEGTEAPEEQNEEDDPSEPPDSDKPDSEDTFTIKVNKEARTVNREEVISLAQKGADYDRVKQQLTDSRQEVEGLKEQIGKSQELLDTLDLISKRTEMTPEKLIDTMFYTIMKGKGVSESEARESLRADRLEKQLKESQNQTARQKNEQDEQTARAARDLAEFRKEFPDTAITEDLIKTLMPDVQSGMSMVSAYRKMEAAKKDAEIAELQRQLAAEKQNKKNRAASPGSQKDSGGKVKREAIDDFIDAL